MSDVSLSLLGVLLMLDICFIANFFVIRAFRRFIDLQTDEAETSHSDNSNTPPGKVGYKANVFETILFGYVLGRVKPDPLSAHHFPQWKPIPYKFGVMTTSVLVLAALTLLSPDFLYTYFGVTINGGTLSGDFCSDEDKVAGLAELELEIKSTTNYDEAETQWEHMNNIYSALQNDTTLYGEVDDQGNDYRCSGNDESSDSDNYLSGDKDQWGDLTVFPGAEYGSYFPGFCLAYLETEITIDETATCGPQEYCLCPTFPNSSPWTWIGWGGKEICAAKVCFTFDYIPCGTVSNDAVVNVENYRAEQLEYAADQVDAALDDIEYPDVSGSISTDAAETFTTLLYQFDVASNVYAIYSCLALFFPAPLEAFRLPYAIVTKQFFFGAQKPFFIMGVVAIWWGYSYLNDILYSYDVQLFFANLLAGDPCYLDAAYLIERQSVLGDICEAILPMEPDFSTASTTTLSIVPEIENFYEECGCKYPMVDLFAFNSENYPAANVSSLGFQKVVDGICDSIDGGCTVYLPDDDISFVGNTSLCEDTDYAQDLILSAPDSDISVYGMWIKSGLLATVLIKFTVSNFAVGLLKLADPFVACDGMFLWIPKKFGMGLQGSNKNKLFAQFKVNKEASLFNITLRGLFVWGFLMHFCLFNLMFVAYSETSDSGDAASADDVKILTACLGIAVGTIVMGLVFIRYLQRLASVHDTANEDCSDEFEDDSLT